MSIFEREPGDPDRKEVQPLVKMALEMGPLAIFFLAYRMYDIFAATTAFMVAVVVALAASWLLTRRLAVMPLVTGIVVLVFGGLTIYLQNDTFIKMKPTVVNALFGTILLGGLAFGRALLGYVFDSVFQLDAEGWRKLTFRWGIFFFALAAINEIVWRSFSEEFWVSFKVFGMMPISIVFTLSQMPLIMKHSIVPDETAEATAEPDVVHANKAEPANPAEDRQHADPR